MTGPAFDDDSRSRGRDRALQARRERAAIKRGLRDGVVDVAEVLSRREEDPAVGRMRVVDLVEAMPGLGPVRAAHVMESCAIAPSRRLRGLGERQASALVRALAPAARRATRP